jgi:hypothetical protein
MSLSFPARTRARSVAYSRRAVEPGGKAAPVNLQRLAGETGGRLK